jgi:hypothetical protein
MQIFGTVCAKGFAVLLFRRIGERQALFFAGS